MNKTTIAVAGMLAAAATAAADVTVTLPTAESTQQLVVTHAPLSSLLKAKTEADLPLVTDTIAVTGSTVTFPLDNSADTRYRITLAGMPDNDASYATDFYARPGDNIRVDITSVAPFKATVTGTPLMDGMTEIDRLTAPIEEQAMQIQSGKATGDLNQLYRDYNNVFIDYIRNHPDSPAAVYALLNVDRDNFIDCMDMLGAGAIDSPLYPFAASRRPAMEQYLKEAAVQRQLASGKSLAPAFTLPDLEGKDVSLEQFRGKWVVLDFWGSWCGWCVKGFPALKEAHKKYGDKLAIIGIDCGDTPEKWREAVRRFGLPWVNLYNAQGEAGVDRTYAVQGFPTKVIINPQGIIVDITAGENPGFYDRLHRFIEESH